MSSINYIKQVDNPAIIYSPVGQVESTSLIINPGVYSISNARPMEFAPAFRPVVPKDNLIQFTSGVVSAVINKADTFLSQNSVDIYKELKIAHKVGMIMHGSHGTGKSCTALLIMNQLVSKYDAVCLDGTGRDMSFIMATVGVVRKHQSNPIVLFIDEIDDHIEDYESQYLTFLDGNNSVDSLIVIGCTNHLDKIPDRIKYRKSRIKHLFEITSMPDAVYRDYILDRLPSITKVELDKFVYLCIEKGLTLDILKHVVIDYRIEGLSIEEAIEENIGVTEVVGSDLSESKRKGLNW